jgi:hypothetical protein
VTRDSARAMVTTIELYLVYGAHLSPFWWMDVCAIKQQNHEVPGLLIGWMGANNESRYGGQNGP